MAPWRWHSRGSGVGALALASLLGLSLGAEQPAPVDLSGRWALLQVTSQIGAIPLVGERTRTTSTLLLLDVTQDGLVLSAQAETCRTTIDNGTSLVRTEIPDAFLLSLPPSRWTAILEPGVQSTRFVRPWVTSVQGARLEDPENDALPTQAEDPRVVDQDVDGKPGLTVHVSVMGLIQGDVYVVQRDRSQLLGTVVSADAVEGIVEWTSEQSVLGASSAFFASGAAARVDPDAEHSYFRAYRVDADTTCIDLDEMEATLFAESAQ
jgi:hypothetical protein